MRYFFLEDGELVAGREVSLSGEDINHAYRVLRLKIGDKAVVSDGRGRALAGTITFSSSRQVRMLPEEEKAPAESSLEIILIQALIKGDRMDLILRQAVELGVRRIVPLVTGRSVPQWDRRQDQKKQLRHKNIIRSAAAQCRRAFLPSVEPARDLEAVLPRIRENRAIVPWENEKILSLGQILKQPRPLQGAVLIFIGPEGGFERWEIETLVDAGALTAHLGPRILRSETAAVAAISMVQAAWGDLSAEGEL